MICLLVFVFSSLFSIVRTTIFIIYPGHQGVAQPVFLYENKSLRQFRCREIASSFNGTARARRLDALMA
jgi:hypothetical protein